MTPPDVTQDPSPVIDRISLRDFRAYETLDFAPQGQSVFLFGANGAGKTNLLEAISVFGPGRGLRGAAFIELGRKDPAQAQWPWAASLHLKTPLDTTILGTGSDPRDATKRIVRRDGEPLKPSALLDHINLVWLTPAQDRIFVEARAERLRFFDRLVFADQPDHAKSVLVYEKALRERLKILIEGGRDTDWLDGLELRLAEAGFAMIDARRNALKALQTQINSHDGAFPKADLTLWGDENEAIDATNGHDQEIMSLRDGFRRARGRDQAAGRSLYGPHRQDLKVFHRGRNAPAQDCSTGEQKALILNMILAQGARLALKNTSKRPIVLLDEVAAHLDPQRRHALFDETMRLGLQTFFTGTDLSLFDGLVGRAMGARVDSGQIIEYI